MFRFLQMSGRGSDGYPLDVHGAKLAAAAAGSDLDAGTIAGRRSRTRRAPRARAVVLRRAGQPRDHSRPPSSDGAQAARRRISCERGGAASTRFALTALAFSAGAVPPRAGARGRAQDADLRGARRQGPRARPLHAREGSDDASARHRLPAWRRLVGRHAHDRSGLPALLRAGRLRDGVDRVPAHARDHVPVERRGREDRRAVAASERRRASARSESDLSLGHVGGRSPGRRRGARAQGHVRRRGQPRPSRAPCSACSMRTVPRSST